MTGTSSIIRLSGSAGPHNDAGAETDKNTLWGLLEIPTVLRPHRSPYGRQYNGTTKHNCTSSFPDTKEEKEVESLPFAVLSKTMQQDNPGQQ